MTKTTREIEADKNSNILLVCVLLIIIFCSLNVWITYKMVMNKINPQEEKSYTYFFHEKCKVVLCDCSSIGIDCPVCVRCPTKNDVDIGG